MKQDFSTYSWVTEYHWFSGSPGNRTVSLLLRKCFFLIQPYSLSRKLIGTLFWNSWSDFYLFRSARTTVLSYDLNHTSRSDHKKFRRLAVIILSKFLKIFSICFSPTKLLIRRLRVTFNVLLRVKEVNR